MIIDFENIIILIPMDRWGDKKREEENFFKNLVMTDYTKDIFIIAASTTLKEVSWNIERLILENPFKLDKKAYGASYWVMEREKDD